MMVRLLLLQMRGELPEAHRRVLGPSAPASPSRASPEGSCGGAMTAVLAKSQRQGELRRKGSALRASKV